MNEREREKIMQRRGTQMDKRGRNIEKNERVQEMKGGRERDDKVEREE